MLARSERAFVLFRGEMFVLSFCAKNDCYFFLMDLGKKE